MAGDVLPVPVSNVTGGALDPGDGTSAVTAGDVVPTVDAVPAADAVPAGPVVTTAAASPPSGEELEPPPHAAIRLSGAIAASQPQRRPFGMLIGTRRYPRVPADDRQAAIGLRMRIVAAVWSVHGT